MTFRRGSRLAWIILLPGLLAACASPPGGPSREDEGAPRHFQTWTDQRFANVVRQATEFSCGSASLATIGRYLYERDLTENQVTETIKARYAPSEWEERERDGLSMLDLKTAAEGFGFAAQGARMTLQDLARLRGPVIVHLNKGPIKHFAVFRGIRGDRVYLADSIAGNTRVPIFRFADEWTGNVLIVWLDGRPLPARYPLALHADASLPEALDIRRALYATAPPVRD